MSLLPYSICQMKYKASQGAGRQINRLYLSMGGDANPLVWGLGPERIIFLGDV